MTRIVLLLIVILTQQILLGQEIVQSEIQVNSVPVSSCISCDGSVDVFVEIPGVKTFNWFDESGVLIYDESTSNNMSSLSDLCLGSYFIEISNNSEITKSVWVSVTEADVDLDLFGEFYICNSAEEIVLNELDYENSSSDGFWSDESGNVMTTLEFESLEGESRLSYNILNESCLNSVIYPVVINAPANTGSGTTYFICENYDEFELIEPMSGDPDENGVWYDSNNEVFEGYFYPETDDSEQFVYVIDTVLGCPASFSILNVVKSFIPYAGENGTLLTCYEDDQSIELFSFLENTPDEGGDWYDMNNEPIDGYFNPATMESGPYRYTLSGNVPCPADIAYVNVEIHEELFTGEGGEIALCSTDLLLDFNDYLSEEYTLGGSWLDQEGNEISSQFDPSIQDSQSVTYEVSGLGCETVQGNFEIQVEEFYSAGESSSLEFCEFSETLDLNTLLTENDSDAGYWMANGEMLESSLIDGSPIAESFTYLIDHQICDSDSSILELTIIDNPLFPSISSLSVCDDSDVIDLNSVADFQEEWTSTWTNQETNLIESSFDPSLGQTGNYFVEVDPQNICGAQTVEIYISVESNAFESGNLVFEFCSTEGQINLNNLIENEIGSSDFVLQDFPDFLDPNEFLGANSFLIEETNLSECTPSVLSVDLNVFEFNEANPDIEEQLCENSSTLDLSDYNSDSGNWIYELAVLDTPFIAQTVENSGSYYFFPENHELCPQVSQLVELEFFDTLIIPEIDDVMLCEGEGYSVQSPLIGNGFSTEWNFNQEISNANLLSLTSDMLQIGDNEIEYSISNNVCQNSSSFLITLNPTPVFEIQNSSSYCSGDLISLSIEPQLSGVLSWSVNGDLESNDPNLEYIAESSEVVSASIIDMNNCVYSDEIQTQVFLSPEIEISEDPQILCGSSLVNLSYINESLTDNHYWSINGEVFQQTQLNIELDTGDHIDVYLTAVSENGCTTQVGQDDFFIGAAESVAEFSLSSTTISDIGDPIAILNESINFDQSDWFLNDMLISSEAEKFDLYFDDFDETNSLLCLEVNNAANCPDTLCKDIKLIEELTVYIPNAFTPDNDGLNESFNPILRGHSELDYEFLIFDRWGEVIFRSTSPSAGWDGSVNNGDHYVSPGIYSYIITVRAENTLEKEQITGSVTLVR